LFNENICGNKGGDLFPIDNVTESFSGKSIGFLGYTPRKEKMPTQHFLVLTVINYFTVKKLTIF
jgi:hypothetical protein